jgi:hypothetical protein
MALILKKTAKDSSSNQARAVKWKIEEICKTEMQIGEAMWKMENFIQYYPRTNSFSMQNLYYVKLIEATTSLEIWKKPMTGCKEDIKLYEIHRPQAGN